MFKLAGSSPNTALKQILKGFTILLIVLFIGTTGYMNIEQWDLLDSLYMTVITITTVGFHEVKSVSGVGRIFTIFIIFSGVGIIAYILGMVAQSMVDVQVRAIIGRRRLGIKLRSIKNHYIICGFGRIGKIISRELKAEKIPVVIVDNNPGYLPALEAGGFPFINDDATNEEVLIEAGIKRAYGLVSCVASDADNLFITMSARGINSALFILARADEEQTEKKLMRAGANRVVMPYLIGGHQMAQTIVKPTVTDFLEFTMHNKKIGLELEELVVGGASEMNGVKLIDSGIRQKMDVMILAIRKKGGDMQFNPSSQTCMEEGDTLISLGKKDDLARFESILTP